MISDELRAANSAGAIATGLLALKIPVPLTTVQWADRHYYLPKESSYTPGRWETLPFQVAIMNSMGNDRIRTVNLIKSARVGYTKMLLGVEAYFIEHKSRNSLLFQPTDSAAEDFMKSHVEPTIRDVPVLLDLAPWFGRKHRDNTLTLKRFSSGVGFWCLGGAAAKNYREKSVDVVCYDELSSFEPDVEKEGSPTLLGDKRIEGSVWPKSIRGSTPKIKGTCQIEKAANESAHFMRFYVPCPHCGEEQYLKFGDESTPFGLKWEKDSPESVFYLCEHHGCVIHQSELDQSNGRWICENTGMWTRDGLTFFSAADNEIPPPRSITFHIWTAYSPFTTWVQIVYDWLDALKDPNGVKTFVNTTLGETWEEAVGEKLDHQVLMDKVVRYTAAVPARVTVEKARPILAASPQANAGPSLRDQIMALDEAKGAEAQAEKLAACPGMTVENARAVLAAGSGKAEPVSASTTALFEHFMANHSPAAVRGGVSQTSADGDADVKMLMAMP